jgi:tetratricopeptide (TPR) repeat protein
LSVEDYSLAIAQASYLKYGKAEEFANLLQYIVSEISGSGLSFALLGETYAEQLNKPDMAIEAYQNAILIDNKVSQYHNGLGLAYHKKNEFKIALKHFSDAVKVDPSDAIARYNLACMFSRLGNPNDALASLQEAFALSPDLISTAQTDPDLNNVRSLSAFEKIVSEVNSIDEDIEEALSH